jgi:hypothetical protein
MRAGWETSRWWGWASKSRRAMAAATALPAMKKGAAALLQLSSASLE